MDVPRASVDRHGVVAVADRVDNGAIGIELLEELLQGYAGTVFLVSHDRRFLDNVVTSTIAWEGDEVPGRWREYEGGYEDWRVQRERALALREAGARAVTAAVKASTPAGAPGGLRAAAAPAAARPRKLSYKEQRELDQLPARIEALEAEQRELAAFLARPESYTLEAGRAVQAQVRHAEIDDELLAALERWDALGSR